MKSELPHKRPLRWSSVIVMAIGQVAAWAGTPGTESYTYDALGRVTTITFPDDTRSSYDYDPAGNRVSVSTGVDNKAPSAPTALAATSTLSTKVNLTWTGSTDTGGSGLAGYKIFRNGSTTALATTTGTGTTYADITTVGTTAYTYIVKAYDGALNISGPSNTASVTTPDSIAPTTPGITSWSLNSNNTAKINWSASTDTGGSGLSGYRVSYGCPTGGVLGTTTALTYTDPTPHRGMTCTYTVQAYDHAGNYSASSNAATVTFSSNFTDTPSMTVGGDDRNTGFSLGIYGSMSPAATSNGFTYNMLDDHDASAQSGGGWVSSIFSVQGFTADPGRRGLYPFKSGPTPSIPVPQPPTFIYRAWRNGRGPRRRLE